MRLFRFKRRRPKFQERKADWSVKRRRSRSLRFRQRLSKKFWIFLGSFVAIGAATYAVFFTPILTIDHIIATTEYKDVKTDQVEALMNDLVLDKNTLLINTGSIEEQIYEAFPEVSSVACGRNIFKKQLSCNAYGYELVAVIKHEGQRYYINENGVIIAFDSRKLGLPILDLVLNPVFSNDRGVILTEPEEAPEDPVPALPKQPELSELSTTASILRQRSEGTLLDLPEPTLDVDTEGGPDPEAEPQPLPDEGELLTFIQPDEVFLIQAQTIIQEPRNPFEVEEGKKILDVDELQTILKSINQLEKDFQRKVTKAQYVQVAGELSLKSTYVPLEDNTVIASETNEESEASQSREDQTGVEGNPEDLEGIERNEEEPPAPLISEENPDHELEILLDLKRDLEKQFKKLRRAREVINFAESDRIDLSIEGNKVFYR